MALRTKPDKLIDQHYNLEMLLPHSMLSLGDELAIFEDMDRQENYSPEELNAMFCTHTKAENIFGIVICLQGEIELDWGGKSILLHHADMMFFQSGTLGGLRGASSDARSLLITTREDFFKPQQSE